MRAGLSHPPVSVAKKISKRTVLTNRHPTSVGVRGPAWLAVWMYKTSNTTPGSTVSGENFQGALVPVTINTTDQSVFRLFRRASRLFNPHKVPLLRRAGGSHMNEGSQLRELDLSRISLVEEPPPVPQLFATFIY